MTGHADKTADRRGRAADIEHGVEHAGHRARGARADRDEQWPPVSAKRFAGRFFQKADALGEAIGNTPPGSAVAANARRAEFHRKHECGRYRQPKRGNARQICGLGADDLGGSRIG